MRNSEALVFNVLFFSFTVYQLNTLAISLAVLGVVVVASAAIVPYKMYYQAHKIRKYRLKKQQAAGTAMEEKCLNGNAPTV